MPEGVVSSVLRPSHQLCRHILLSLLSNILLCAFILDSDACVFTSCAVRYSHALRLYLDPRLCKENWIQFRLQLALV